MLLLLIGMGVSNKPRRGLERRQPVTVVIKKTDTHHLHPLHVNSNTLQAELGVLFGVLFAVAFSFLVGGGTGKTLAIVFALPLIYFGKWLSEPIVHLINEEDTGPVKITELSPEAAKTRKKPQPVVETDEKHPFTHPRAVGDEWVCICGAHNKLDRDARIQNCCKCFRSRDFVLQNY